MSETRHPPLRERVQDIVLGRPPVASPGDFDEALAAAIRAMAEASPERWTAMARCANVLNDGVMPGATASEIFRQGTVLNLYRYEREPDWPYGTHASRRQLIELFWAHAVSVRDAGAGEAFGRAAVLLAAEEGPPFGLATLRWLTNRPSFRELTALSEDKVAAIASVLDVEERVTGRFVMSLKIAQNAMDPLLADPAAMDPAMVSRLVDELETIAGLAAGRADIQWRLANMVWRLANIARTRGRDDVASALASDVARWKEQLDDPSASRWLDEAMTAPAPPLRTSGFGRVTSAEARRMFTRATPTQQGD